MNEIAPQPERPFRVLPSQANIVRMVNGDLSGNTVPLALRDWLCRAILIGIGLKFAGVKGDKLVKASAVGALAIDGFIVVHTLWHNRGVKVPPGQGGLF